MKHNRALRLISLFVVLSKLISAITAVSAGEEAYEQNFNNNLDSVTAGDFTCIERPADGSETYTGYTPNGSKDGAFMSNKDSKAVALLELGKAYTGKVILEADFRLEGRAYTSSSGQMKMFDVQTAAGTQLCLIGNGNCHDNGYEFRPVCKYPDNTSQVKSYKVNGSNLEYKKWHHLKVEFMTDTEKDEGTITFYVNGYKIFEGGRPWGGIDLGKLKDIAVIKSYHSSAGAFPYMIDNVRVYNETVSVSDRTDITSSVYKVSGEKISNVPENTSATDFKAAIVLPSGATMELYDKDQEDVVTGTVSDGDKLVVTAEDKKTTAVYTVLIIKELLPFEQNFNDNISNVTLNGFETIVFPEDDVTDFTSYTPDGSKNGAAKSSMENGKKMKIDFGGSITGQVVFEAKFRYDGDSIGSGTIKFFDIYTAGNKDVLMITSGNFTKDGFRIRPIFKNADKTTVTNFQTTSVFATKKWHTIKAELDTDEGLINLFVDDEEILSDVYPYGGILDNISYVQSYHSAEGHTSPFLIDDVKVYNNPNAVDKLKDTTVKSAAYSVGEDTIGGVASGTAVDSFVSALSVRSGAKIAVYSDYDNKVLREGNVDNGDVVEVTAPDGVTKKCYSVSLVIISTEYYVAPDGNDGNKGTIDAPFATLSQAKAAVRSARSIGKPITVYFKAGTYDIDGSTAFTAEDSGTAEAPITYKAYGDGKVWFKGSVSIPSSAIKKVTDEKILDRVISDFAKTKLMQINLKENGVTNIPEIPDVYGYAFGGWRPMEVYINGKALSEARWPNGNTYLKVIETNGQTTNFTMKYNDDTDRASNWTKSIEDKQICVQGSPSYPYAGQHLKLVDIDVKNRVVTGLKTNYAPNTSNANKFFFANLVEEIDLPGESWLDRKNGIVYFYPDSDITNAEIEVSVFDNTVITLNGTEYVNFEDLAFGYTRSNFIKATNVSNITIDGCEFAHNSSNAIELNGTNCEIKNCHIYDLGGAAATGSITISGGDRVNLIPSGNKIINNRMHFGDRVYQVGQSSLIKVAGGVGHVIENNELYNGSAYVVQIIGANDIQFNYNEVHDAVLQSSDAGAVTWGRDMSLMGFELKYNYFHHNGNPHGGVGQQSIFADDAATGPYAYGNIFYKGTLNASEAQNIAAQYSAYKTNGGGYGALKNNIFVDSIGATYFQPWTVESSSFENNKYRWWKAANNIYTGSGSNYWDNIEKYILSDAWKARYKGTQWENVGSRFSVESHNKAKELKASGDEAALNAYIKTVSPDNPPNEFTDNIVINTALPTNKAEGSNGNSVEKNTYRRDDDKLASGASMFKDYGKDFALTDAGLAEVRKTAPEFKNIPTEKIGIQPYERDGKTLFVGTREPSVSNVMLSGDTTPGGVLKATYKFEDPDGEREGSSDIKWFYSAKKNGTFEQINDAKGHEMVVTDDMSGGYVYCTVTPYDINQVNGEAVASEILQLAKAGDVNRDALRTAIAEAKNLIETSQFGPEVGQYPTFAKETLEKAILSAEEVMNDDSSNQSTVNSAAKSLNKAIAEFLITKIEAVDGNGITLNSAISDGENWYFENNGSTISDSKVTVKPNFGSYKGRKYKDEFISFKMNVSKDTSWAGIYLRQNNPDAIPWSGNSGMLIVIKPDQIETQIRDGGSPVTNIYPNNCFRFGEDVEVEVGIIDSNENECRIVLFVNGEQVINDTRTDCPLSGRDGYFGIYSSGGQVTVSRLDVDFDGLSEAIKETESFLASSKAGKDYGDYGEEEMNKLKDALLAAKEVYENKNSNQRTLDKAALLLTINKSTAEGTIVTHKNFTDGGTVSAIYDNGKLSFNYPDDKKSALTVENGKALPEIEGLSPSVKFYIAEDTVPNGTEFILPYKAASDVSGMDYLIKTGGAAFDKPIRFVISGAGKNEVSYKKDGNWIKLTGRMTSDSLEVFDKKYPNGGTARYVDGNDLVIWTTNPSDIGILSEADNTGDDIEDNNNGAVSGGNVPMVSGGGSVGTSASYTGDSENRGSDIPFNDMKNHWAKNDVAAMFKAGIVSGVSETRFDPDRNITRAEFAAIIARAIKLPEKKADFKDINGEWFENSVGACADAGIISGYDGLFRPNDNITRQEMAVIIVNAYSYLKKDAAVGGIDSFTDKSEIADWAREAVDIASSVGLISGMGDGTFAPNANATRAQATSLVSRLIK